MHMLCFPSRSVFIHLSMSFKPSFYLSVRLSVQPSVCLFVSPFIQYVSSVHPSVYLTIYHSRVFPLKEVSIRIFFYSFRPSIHLDLTTSIGTLGYPCVPVWAKCQLFYVLREKESPLDLIKK